MEQKREFFQAKEYNLPSPSCSFDASFLRKLFKDLSGLTKEAAQLEASALPRKVGQTDEEYQKLQEYGLSLYKLDVHIWGEGGEYISSNTESIFDEEKLPHRVTRIVFDNSFNYRYSLKTEPQNQIRIVFDFSNPKVWDFSIYPSAPTPNSSTILIKGQNQTWVDGAYTKVMESLKERKTRRGWFHKGNIYDFFQWFVVTPLAFRSLFRIGSVLNPLFVKITPVGQVAFYLYAFLMMWWVFMVLFKYSRWLFPYMELVTTSNHGAKAHRTVYSVVLLGLLTILASDFIRFIGRLL